MSPEFSVWRLAERIATDPGAAWVGVVTLTAVELAATADDLLAELGGMGLSTDRVAASTAAEVEAALAAGGDRTIVAIVDALDPAEWQRLDRARARLEGAGATRVVFLMSEAAAASAAANAPNLWSFLASAIYRVVEEQPLPEPSRNARVAALEARYGMSSDAIVAMAERGEASPDPDVAEWLILLGRSELIPGRRTT